MSNLYNNSNAFQLIKSLKKGEKRCAALYLAKHKKDSNLLELYRIISAKSTKVEAEVSLKIKNKKLLSQLNGNKFKLYNLLLDALDQFHLRQSPYARILTMLNQSEILLNKGLSKARAELLLKAGKLADEYELPVLKLEIVRLRNVGTSEPGFLKETKQIANKITDLAELKHLSGRIVHLQNKTGDRPTLAQRKYFGKLLSVFQKKYTSQDSIYSKLAYSNFLMAYHRISGEYNEAYLSGMKILKLFKQYPNMLRIQTWKISYCNVLTNLLPFSISKSETTELIYNEIMNLDISILRKNIVTINILDIYVHTGEFKKGEKFLNYSQSQLPVFYSHYHTLVLYSNLALMNFGLGIYSKALFWMNKILNSSKNELKSFPYTEVTRLIRLITYYELKKLDVLEYEINATSNYITKHGKIFKMDALIIDYLLKMISINNGAELKKVMEEARNKLLQLARIKTEARTLEFFDFISWFESKIENKSFEEVVKEKAKKKLRSV